MNNCQISIIIPVYKAEYYLVRCLNSIIDQTYTEWECLLIDDGSPDNSGLICDAYVSKDSRFRVFHKLNGGVSKARNIGLDNALGDWITFVDSDDFLSPEYLEHLIKPIFADSRVSFVHGCGTYYENGKCGAIIEQFPDIISSDPVHLFNTFKGYVCGKLFKRSLIEQSVLGESIRFNSNIRYSEDMVFTLEYILGVNTYAFSSEVGYYYNRDNSGSATHSIKMSYEESLYAFRLKYNYEMQYVQSNGISEKDISNRVSLLAKALLTILQLLNNMPLSKENKVTKMRVEIGIDKLHVLSYIKLPLIMGSVRELFLRGYYKIGFALFRVASKEWALYNSLYYRISHKQS